jgi:hypothetical protein
MFGEGFKAAMGGGHAARAKDANLFKVHAAPWKDNDG